MKKVNSSMFRRYAFTVVELMVILVIISCIMAAFAPIISTRLNSEQINSPTETKLKNLLTDCTAISSDCYLCDKQNRCLVCELECLSNQTLNIEKCVCE